MDFTNLHLRLEPYPTLSYRSGQVVYEESLTRGQFIGRSWNGAGYINPEDLRLAPSRHPTPQTFWLEVDGQLLASHWQWLECSQTQEKRGLDVSRRYHVTFDNCGASCSMEGWALTQQGIVIRLEGALTSELLIFQAE